jgi:hypothetical protein
VTDVQIVNRALRILGCPTFAAAMTDVTPKAVYRAITAYALCRDETLRLLPWPSCVRRALMLNWAEQATPWTALAAYEIGDRCTNDTAKTYQCITAGVAAGAGGPTGTASDITDGTVHWAYQEASTAANNWCWQALHAYVVDDVVSNNTGKVYVCTIAGTSAAAGGPTGTTSAIVDGTVTWRYYGTPGKNRTVYAYLYIIPPDCLRILKVPNLYALTESEQGVQYIREGKWLYCDQEDAFLKYIKQEEDPTNWDELLQWTVALKIASEIAVDVTNGEKAAAIEKRFAEIYATARIVAMGEAAEGPPEVARWEDA